MANAPRLWPEGTSTHQGFYIMGPDGRHLAGSFGRTSPEQARKMMTDALAAWKRTGAAMKPVPREKLALFGGAEPVPGGLKLEIGYRDLPRGEVRRPSTAFIQNPYNLGWFDLSPDEARSLRTESSKPAPIPAALFQRLATKTLKDAVRGQAGEWKAAHLRAGELNTQLVSSRGGREWYRLTGSAHLEDGGRSFRAQLHGRALFDRSAGKFTGFELVAAGQRTGRNGANGRENDLGPAPMGVAFRLFDPDKS